MEKRGAKLEVLQGKQKKLKWGRQQTNLLVICLLSYVSSALLIGHFIGKSLSFLPVSLTMALQHSSAINLSLALTVLSWIASSLFSKIRLKNKQNSELLPPPSQKGELILGTSPGHLSHNDTAKANEEWVTIPGRGVNTGIMVTGSIGSGKTEGAVLPFARQVFCHPQTKPPGGLFIDPKGTFIAPMESMLDKANLMGLVIKIKLGGKVTINPIYVEKPLKNARFAEIAEMVRSAAINFMGKSSDSPFWDVSSSYLIRNTIIFCAASLGYYTLLDLYKTIVRANSDDLAEELEEAIAKGNFDEEEVFNIRRAIEYFKNEYTQLEDRVRSGIVATSTAFINQFQEYGASRIFCPSKEEITIKSMDTVVLEGRIILFDIQKPGLARSMGTLIKLLYCQAVLNNIVELKKRSLPITNAIIIDEYQDVVTCGGGGTLGDESFVAKSRESKSFFLAATQSVSSIINAIGNPRPAMELLQNFRTRIACHSLDIETSRIFKDLAGKELYKSETHSLSESSPSATLNILTGDFTSKSSSLNESISRSERKEDLVTAGDFSRLKTFESYALVFDGIESKFLKLFLKPNFLKKINTKHEDVLSMLSGQPKSQAKKATWINLFSSASIVAILCALLIPSPSLAIPNVCHVASSSAFSSCLDLNIGACTCGFPPHPCASISYYVPQTFIEVWPEPKTSYFSAIPGASLQLSKITPRPYGAEADNDTQSYQARTIAVPLASLVFQSMPARGTRMEKMCFDGMSEHFGEHWDTGKSDMLQPTFLAWGTAPKACLMKGAISSGNAGTLGASDSAICSFPLPKIDMFPPSPHPVCNGWGVFFPRYGTYSGPASMTGALMIASRIKSLSVEVIKSMPQSPDEKWQMIYPQTSSCFREGENISILESIKNARETSRLTNGKLKGYLFVVWKRTSTCKEMPSAVQAQAAALAIPAACKGMK